MEERVEVRAMKFAESYFQKMGWEVKNVSHARGEHAGYDLYLEKDTQHLKVEVKGCTRLYQIPDPYHTEFDRESRQLIADELCIVYFLPETQSPQLARIPREAILPEHVIPKAGYRISGKFKNRKTIDKFMVEVEET